MSAPGTPISKPIPSGPDADTPHPLTAMDIYHVFVPPELRGRGVAAALVEKALAHARAQRMLVVPTCPYVAQYLRQHPEHADLLRPPSA
jgi:predicted GNAT family acetyltransferase